MDSKIDTRISGVIDNVLASLEEHNRLTEEKVGKHHSNMLIENKENEHYHDTYYFEQEYYSYVEKGDIEGLKAFILNIPNMNAGRTATDSLRQAKNLFIASTTLITRRAIEGGLDIETAYQLSDSYILPGLSFLPPYLRRSPGSAHDLFPAAFFFRIVALG